MLKTLKPEEMNAALGKARQRGKVARAYTLTPQARAELKRLAAEHARRTSAHWHFKVAADGRPTCHLPTLDKPSGRHKRVPISGHESALEAMDRYVTGWGDKDSPSRKLQWRDE
jgi:hypothetical protein